MASESSVPPNDPMAVYTGDDINAIWESLLEGIDRIMDHPETPLENAAHMQMYTTIYNYCVSTRNARSLGEPAGAHLYGGELYDKLSQYLTNRLEPMKEKATSLQGEELLRYYSFEWQRYKASSQYLNRLFGFMNRHWVKRTRDEGRRGVYPIFYMAIALWRTHMFEFKEKQLAAAILLIVDREDDTANIDPSVVKDVVSMFVSMGFDDSDPQLECLHVYRQSIETPFVDAVTPFYTKGIQPLLAEDTFGDFLKRIEEMVDAAKKDPQTEKYLHSSTHEALIRSCENVMVLAHSDVIKDFVMKYTDTILRKSRDQLNTEEDLERELTRIILVMKALPDKSTLASDYKIKLQERLDDGATATDLAEAMMLSKLGQIMPLTAYQKLVPKSDGGMVAS